MSSAFSGVVLVALLNFVQYASSIFCYDCNSAFDPRCGEQFDPYSLGVVNCSLRDPPEHLNVSEPSICRSIKMESKYTGSFNINRGEDCNSAFDPHCSEQFDPCSLEAVNCSLRDPPEYLNVSEPSICRLCRYIKMEIFGKVRVVRTCGYIAEDSEKPCLRRPGNGDVFVTYCSCATDLCNRATGHDIAGAVLVAAMLLRIC